LRRKTLAAVAVPAALALTLAGGSSATEQQALRMAVVTDIGGLNDRGFNQAANAARIQAQRQLGFQTRVWDTKTAADRLPNLEAAAQQGFNLIIANGFFMFEHLNKVAPAYPNLKFAGVDIELGLLSAKPTNYRGLTFREQEAGYLVGYIAGLVVRNEAGPDIISAVGANRVPAIIKYIAGYRAGARRANPRVRVLVDYANDPTFADQAKCKETALNQIERGTRIIFQVAGGCGLGALDAARERRLWGIGVDQDQTYFGRHMLTAALKDVRAAVFQTAQEFKRSPARFRTGFNKVFTVKNGGLGYAKISTRVKGRAAIIRKVEAIKKLIAAGRIKPPTQ